MRHPDVRRLDMKAFVNRPIPRLSRYELLLEGILKETPDGHADCVTIPIILNALTSIGKEIQPGVVLAKQKVELWGYAGSLAFEAGEHIV